MKKKALLVANTAGFGSFLSTDMNILNKMGYEIVFAANASDKPRENTIKMLNENNVKFKQIDFNFRKPCAKENLKAYFQIKSLLKEEHYDLIHCHTPIIGFIVRLAAAQYRRLGTKIIYTTHGFSFTEYSNKKTKIFYYTLEKMMSYISDAIITINHDDYIAAKTMLCNTVYYINGMGIDVNHYNDTKTDKNEYRLKNGLPVDKVLILSIGELSVRKNHQIMIKAISELDNSYDYIYVICGNGVDGSVGQSLRKLAFEKNVDLRLLGFRRDIPQLIRCSDFGALPSLREGLGLAGLQSLAAGVPIIGSRVQGIKDYVVEGETGFLCNPFSVNDFSEAIKKLTNNGTRNDMAESCKNKAKEFDTQITYKQKYDIYMNLLNDKVE